MAVPGQPAVLRRPASHGMRSFCLLPTAYCLLVAKHQGHVGAADLALAFQGAASVLHGRLLSVLDGSLGAALHAIRFLSRCWHDDTLSNTAPSDLMEMAVARCAGHVRRTSRYYTAPRYP